MSAFADGFVPGLLRATTLLAVSATVVWMMIRLLGLSSPRLLRAASVMVLIQGLIVVRLPVAIPWHGPSSTGSLAPADPEPRAANPPGDFDGPEIPPVAPASPTPVSGGSWSLIVLVIWLVGIAALTSASLVAYLRFLTGLRLKEPDVAEWIQEWASVLAEAGVRRPIPLQTSPELGPMLCRLPDGYRVIVPEGLWRGLSRGQRMAILRHELAHYRGGDLGKSLAVRGLALLHWFNPFAWWAARTFDECAEWACDQVAIGGHRAEAAEYARALVQVSERIHPLLLSGAGARGHSLSVRIRRLLAVGANEDPTMKKVALFGLSGLLVAAGMIRFDLVAQESARGGREGPGPPRGEPHLVLPVQTELQRLILGKDVSAFVSLDLRGVVKDGELDQAALRSIGRDLAAAGARVGIVRFRIFHDRTSSSNEDKRLHDALKGLARAAGFRSAKVDEELRNDDVTWRQRIATLDGDRPGLPGGDEPGMGNQTVRIYPVRTPLSRYLFEGSDCVVDFLAAPDPEVEDRVRVSIKAMAKNLDLARKQRIHFRVPADKVDERSRVPLQERLDRLAKSLGFRRSQVSY
jgi:beta-lactamase regulating signal transducer with metallopeptidase domain